MPSLDVSIAAATAVVGFDLMRDQEVSVSGGDRVITGAAIMGSAAAQDTEVHLKVGLVTVSKLLNRTTGAPNMDDVVPLEAVVPAGDRIAAVVVDAPATNPINMKLMYEELE